MWLDTEKGGQKQKESGFQFSTQSEVGTGKKRKAPVSGGCILPAPYICGLSTFNLNFLIYKMGVILLLAQID